MERVIDSIRRKCLGHVIVFNENSLRRIISAYCVYYDDQRTDVFLGKDALRKHEEYRRSPAAKCSRVQKLAVYIITTNAALRDRVCLL